MRGHADPPSGIEGRALLQLGAGAIKRRRLVDRRSWGRRNKFGVVRSDTNVVQFLVEIVETALHRFYVCFTERNYYSGEITLIKTHCWISGNAKILALKGSKIARKFEKTQKNKKKIIFWSFLKESWPIALNERRICLSLWIISKDSEVYFFVIIMRMLSLVQALVLGETFNDFGIAFSESSS